MQTIPRLPAHRRSELIRLGRRSGDPDTFMRFLVVARLTAGLSRNRVAQQVGVAVSTVIRTAQRFLRYGINGLYDRRRSNGQRKVSDSFRQHLGVALCGIPQDYGWERPTWTRELLCLEMEERGFPLVSVCTMGRALANIGARLGRPKPIVLCPWPHRKRDALLAELRALVDSATMREPVFYSDEVDIHLNPKIGPDWMLRGMQRQIVTPGKNEKRYIAGALDVRTGKLSWIVGERKRSDLFCQLLWRLASQHRDARRIHLIVDNYIIHSSKITQRCVAQFGGRIVLHFLPPYCPDHNRIERVWLDLHANVTRNHRCPTMPVLLKHVVAFLHAYNRRHLHNPALRHAIRAAA
jgi:transposase